MTRFLLFANLLLWCPQAMVGDKKESDSAHKFQPHRTHFDSCWQTFMA